MRRKKRSALSLALALALSWGLALPAAAEGRHDLAAGSLVLDAATCPGGCLGHTVTGRSGANTIQITGGSHTVILDGVSMQSADEQPPISVTGGAQAAFELRGKNTVAADDCAGILVSGSSATLGGSGSLDVLSRDTGDHMMDSNFQSCGIFLDRGDLNITGGTLSARAEGRRGAGIGGREMYLKITGGTVDAQGSDYGPGIGGAPIPGLWERPRAGTVEITGGTVNAAATHGSAIGTGEMAMELDIILTGGSVTAEGGYGLGGELDAPATMPPSLYHGDVNVYIDGVDLTAKGGEYAAIQGNAVQITGGAKVEAVGDIRALELGVFNSEVAASGGLTFFVPFEMLTSSREEELRDVWGGEPEARIAIVDSTVAAEGPLAYHALGGGRLDIWDSEVTAGGIGNYAQKLDSAVEVNLHSGQVDSIGSSGILGDVTIYGGTVHAEGTSGAGIGGPAVTIFDGDVEARGGDYGAGIGGGAGLLAGVVSICGGTVTATGGADPQSRDVPVAAMAGGAGIGGGGNGGKNHGNLVAIYGGTVVARGGVPNYAPPLDCPHDGAGIGGGFEGDSGKIYIAGGDVTAYGSHAAAGIGGGGMANGGEIVITGGTVTAYGGDQAAAIGGGWGGHRVEYGRAGDIFIAGGTVKAVGDEYGAGIGNGMATLPGAGLPARIVISGGDVTAQGGDCSSGIGGSGGGDFGIIRSPDADPDMEGVFADIRKGLGGADGGEILIGGDAKVTATGAAGAWGIGAGIPLEPENGFRPGDAPELTILDGAQVDATLQGKYAATGTLPDAPEIPPEPAPNEGEKPVPAPIPTVAESPFEDVPRTAWYYGAVCYAVENGLFKGTSATAFSPDCTMDRAMLVTVLHRMSGAPAPAGTASFTDVAAGRWYSDAVLWAAEQGVVSGTGGGLFTPLRPITRQELAVVLYNAEGKPASAGAGALGRYGDGAELPAWAADAVAWMVEQGLWAYQEDGALLGGQAATRAEVAAVMQAFCIWKES